MTMSRCAQTLRKALKIGTYFVVLIAMFGASWVSPALSGDWTLENLRLQQGGMPGALRSWRVADARLCALGHASCNMPVRCLHWLLTNTMCIWGPNRHLTPKQTAGFQPRGAEMTEPFLTTEVVSRATPSSCPNAVAKNLVCCFFL